MRTHPINHLATLTHHDAHRAAWAPLDPDVDYLWTEEVVEHLKVASNALLQAARVISGTDNRGRALQAVAARHGAVAAALMIPAAAAACSRAASRIEDCSGMFGDLLVKRAAAALLTVH
ncbi:MAG: hypothetical protein ACRYG8_27515 [Janthinobacterium lividum]